jgi:hypothetical protein
VKTLAEKTRVRRMEEVGVYDGDEKPTGTAHRGPQRRAGPS